MSGDHIVRSRRHDRRHSGRESAQGSHILRMVSGSSTANRPTVMKVGRDYWGGRGQTWELLEIEE